MTKLAKYQARIFTCPTDRAFREWISYTDDFESPVHWRLSLRKTDSETHGLFNVEVCVSDKLLNSYDTFDSKVAFIVENNKPDLPDGWFCQSKDHPLEEEGAVEIFWSKVSKETLAEIQQHTADILKDFWCRVGYEEVYDESSDSFVKELVVYMSESEINTLKDHPDGRFIATKRNDEGDIFRLNHTWCSTIPEAYDKYVVEDEVL